jgi:hypothetical protein
MQNNFTTNAVQSWSSGLHKRTASFKRSESLAEKKMDIRSGLLKEEYQVFGNPLF